MRILFVCMGNICRSPTAEGVMRGLLRAEGLDGEVAIDSAGIGGWHAGDPPDSRAVAAARSRDIVVEGAAREVTDEDFERFDLLLVMDRENERDLLARAPDARRGPRCGCCASSTRRRSPPATSMSPTRTTAARTASSDVLDLVEAACRGLLDEVRAA